VDSIAEALLDAQNKAAALFAPVVSTGLARHWILEIHFVDRAREIGGVLRAIVDDLRAVGLDLAMRSPRE
jgi:hypothetical protein